MAQSHEQNLDSHNDPEPMNPTFKVDARQAPLVAQLQLLFEERHRISRGLIGRAIGSFGNNWAIDFEQTLRSLCFDSTSIVAAARGYSAFAFDSMRRQKTFETVREYPHKTYAQAASEVYFNDKHMMEEYLPGLLLSHYLWPHHYRQLQFFDTAFLGPMRESGVAEFAEIGVGTAVYSCRILKALPDSSGTGYDISPSSCSFAAKHIAAIGAAARYQMRQQDVIAQPLTPVPSLVCVEVLEHLEDPVTFLQALRVALAPGGRAFITAALNAAHADHIYLYRNGEEVLKHLQAAGFSLEQSFLSAAYSPPAPGVPVPLAAAFVVY